MKHTSILHVGLGALLSTSQILASPTTERFLQIHTFTTDKTGNPLYEINALTFCPTTHHLAVSSRVVINGKDHHKAFVYDLKHKTCLYEIENVGRIDKLLFSPDGTYLIIGTIPGFIVWDVSKKFPHKVFEYPTNDKTRVWCTAFSNIHKPITWLSKNCIAVGCSQKIFTLDVKTCQRTKLLSHQLASRATCLSLSKDKESLAISSDIEHTYLYRYNAEDNKWHFHRKLVPYIDIPWKGSWGTLVTAFSPDGTFLASGCIWEDKCACIYLFDLAQGTCTGSFKMPQEDYLEKIPGISTLSYSPNGELIAAASYKKAYVWNVKTKQALLKLNARDHIIFSSDGHYLAVAHKKGTISKEGAVSLWIQQS